ncbi:hypothetical protein PWG71_17990 [Nocardiopsis sp. N85]|uniref:hypothetical protein n=1 Tax=Nocardiopsis sp. N85 TaxID=3029400 RepID=UPI00237FC54A|nr:hypothetical protein [Nocardiopsis sp. N85]MDE3723288.1 hypothetical protein [Nocardiopsis sp. N85]
MTSPIGRAGLALVAGVLAYFLLQVGAQVVGYEWASLGAAYGFSGETGRVTVTHEERVRNREVCHGTFEPDGDGLAREGVRVHSSGPCEAGRVDEARLLPGEDTWMSMTERDRAYVDAGFGSGAGTSIVMLVLIGAFCSGLGGLFALGALVVGGQLVVDVLRRVFRPQSR